MPAVVRTNVTELPESRVRVEAEISSEEVERRVQQAARQLGRELRVPGFRKGKVPPPVVIRRLGREAVLDEALRGAIGSWYVEAVDEAGITPVGEPELDLGDPPAAGEPLSFSIEIAVRPKAKLGEYKGLEVGRREALADEGAIDQEIERLRERFATLETVERPARQGDFVLIDYLGRIGGEPFAGGEGRDQLLELGSGRLIEGFEEQLVGAHSGEVRTVTVRFPDDYAEELAGREASFEVTVTEVKEKRLPEVDDEFALEAAGLDTVAELRGDVARRLREAEEHEIEHEFEAAVVDAAAAGASIELPDSLVHARAHEMVEETLTMLARQGVNRESYLRIAGKGEHELAQQAEEEAARQLRREAVLEAVVEAEGIEPSEEDLLEALRSSAQSSQTTPEKLLEQLRKRGGLARLRSEVAVRQALERLVAEATPIPLEQARAREQIWTPGSEGAGAREPGGLWTPGS
jgi:trigger factor